MEKYVIQILPFIPISGSFKTVDHKDPKFWKINGLDMEILYAI
jgi:hypothetical protein